VPPNCHFEVDDAEDVWVYGRKFDYIHGRALFSCFKDPVAVFQKAYDALVPGGYFEMQDVYFKPHSIDGTVEGKPFAKWNEEVVEGAKKLGRDWHCVRHYKRWFEEMGFEDVVERRFCWPMNTWAMGKKMKTMGLWCMLNALEGVNSISLAIMTRVLGKSPEEVESALEEVRSDIKDTSIHSYWPV
jgi:Methyltransferase domain